MVEAEFTEEEIDFAMEMIRDLIPYGYTKLCQKIKRNDNRMSVSRK